QKNLPSPAQPPDNNWSLEHVARAFCEHRYDKPEKKSKPVPLSHDRSHTELWSFNSVAWNSNGKSLLLALLIKWVIFGK
ncbi:unnamed protein product, partial [Brassica rapa]